MRKLKFKLDNRQFLENIYITFIRPILEYGSEVWDNCGAVNSDRLEKVQTEAARIVTGLTLYASLDSIYCETGWDKLIVRQKVKKLNLFYKIINNEALEYLSELIPPTVAESNNYNLRNRHNISQPANRLSSYHNSFFPSWLSDFIFYQKPLYKSLHQSFFYSFITILPSESGVTLHYSTILP